MSGLTHADMNALPCPQSVKTGSICPVVPPVTEFSVSPASAAQSAPPLSSAELLGSPSMTSDSENTFKICLSTNSFVSKASHFLFIALFRLLFNRLLPLPADSHMPVRTRKDKKIFIF